MTEGYNIFTIGSPTKLADVGLVFPVRSQTGYPIEASRLKEAGADAVFLDESGEEVAILVEDLLLTKKGEVIEKGEKGQFLLKSEKAAPHGILTERLRLAQFFGQKPYAAKRVQIGDRHIAYIAATSHDVLSHGNGEGVLLVDEDDVLSCPKDGEILLCSDLGQVVFPKAVESGQHVTEGEMVLLGAQEEKDMTAFFFQGPNTFSA